MLNFKTLTQKKIIENIKKIAVITGYCGFFLLFGLYTLLLICVNDSNKCRNHHLCHGVIAFTYQKPANKLILNLLLKLSFHEAY